MKISTKGRYGLRAFVDIALHSEDEPVSLASVARRQDISISYLEQLVAKLKKAGLVASTRGANGGYVLAKPAGEISVGEALRALEGTLAPVECPEISEEGAETCSSYGACVTKTVWKRINDSINETVNSIFIDELVEDMRKAGCREN